jgi:hypothetical protein
MNDDLFIEDQHHLRTWLDLLTHYGLPNDK